MVKKSNNWFELRNWEKNSENVLNMIKIRFGKTMIEFNFLNTFLVVISRYLKARALISGGSQPSYDFSMFTIIQTVKQKGF